MVSDGSSRGRAHSHRSKPVHARSACRPFDTIATHLVAFLVLSELERNVSATVRQRGASYARSGAVRIAKRATPDEVLEAMVVGTIPYTVFLDYADGLLVASCTCPYFADVEICKHIWATIVVCASTRVTFPGPVRGLMGDADAGLYPGGDVDDDDRDDEDEPESGGVPPGRVTQLASYRQWSPPPPRPPQIVPSRWRSQMVSMSSSSYDHSDRGRIPAEIIWVLDPATSGTSVSIEITSRSLKKNGEPGKPQTVRIEKSAIGRIPNEIDRQILTMLASPYFHGSLDPRQMIGWPMAEFIVPKLAETGRLWIRSGKGEYETSVTFDGGEPWRFSARAEEQEGKYQLVGSLRRGEESVPAGEPLAVTSGGFVIFRNSIARFADDGSHSWISLFRRERIEIPAKELDEFARAVATSGSPVRVEFPTSVSWEERRVAPRATLEIRKRSWDFNADALPLFEYDDHKINAFSRTRALYDEATKSIIVRDLAEESTKLEALSAHGITRAGEGVMLNIAPLGELIPKLLEAGWEVRGTEGVYAGFGELDLALRSSIDWFDLEASATFGSERVRLPRLLAALRKGDSFVKLSDGKLGMIRPEWRTQLEPFLATASEEHEGGLRFRRNQVLLLDALLATRQSISFDEVFEGARRKILDVKVESEQPPATFNGTLRPYQNEGLGWFTFLRGLGFGGCLADDMGLGKTIQVLALLDQRRGGPPADRRPSLVVVPRSVVFNWKREAAAFTPGLRILDHSTPDRIQATHHFQEHDVVLTTYALLRKDVELFADYEFDYAILDEAQAIKNASSQAAKAATLIRARHRLALSGTPVENHLGELGSLFEFLNPGMLRAKSSRMTKMLRDAGSRTPEAVEARTMLARTVRPFILRRTKAQVARDLPDRVEQTIFCDLEPKQRKLYDELRDYYRASLLGVVAARGLSRSKIHVLEALLGMRQAACHPGLVDSRKTGEASAKLDKLFEELPILIDERHKVLVFSQFTSLLAIVREGMHHRGFAYAYIDGKSRDREEQVRRFQEDPEVPVFLISLKAGGLGLNLTSAEYVYLLDPWWNPAVEAQAIDRAHRIGQTRNVMAYRLVARDTIEEKILLLQQSKKALAEAIISEENSILRQLTTEDLDLLLS
jgi:superfamily II DNA or RNA helicase